MTSNYVILSIKLRLVQYINIYFGKLYRGWGRGVFPVRRSDRVKIEVVIAM